MKNAAKNEVEYGHFKLEMIKQIK